MALTLDETVKVTHDFLNEYNYNFPLKFRVVEKPHDIYNKEQLEKLYEANDRDRRQIGFDGAYHPSSGRVVLIASSFRDSEHANTALRHEVIGHYGINTLNEQEKRQLLSSISNSRSDPTLQPIWAKVDTLYKNAPESIKAEEVFAFVAEKKSLTQQYSSENTPQSLLRDKHSITRQDLEKIVHTIEHEIRLGVREQQIFPKNDYSQYRFDVMNMAASGRLGHTDSPVRDMAQRNSGTPQLSQNTNLSPYSAGKSNVNQAQATKVNQAEAGLTASNKSLGRTR